MAIRDPDYRPNPGRSIRVCREFDGELAGELLPKIAELRAESNEPITIYINSPGGSIRVLETVATALQCEDMDGNRCRIITVAIGDAASAAAALLTLGNYAIAYPNSVLHFHGVRLSDVEFTMEDATSAAQQLTSLNRRIAEGSAEMCINRIVQRYTRVLPDIERILAKEKNLSEVGAFVRCIHKLISPAARRVLDRVCEKIHDAEKLTQSVINNKNRPAAPLKQDISVFKALLTYELKKMQKGPTGRLDERAVVALVTDYFLLRDFHMGEHFKRFSSILRTQGPNLLNKKDYDTFAKQTFAKAADAEKWLDAKIGELMRDLWHYSVTLCRQLQSGENRFTAKDAYWLGCVDEIYGTNLHGERALAEIEVPDSPA